MQKGRHKVRRLFQATHRSDEPVSKSKFKVTPLVPMVTGQRYSESYCSGLAVTVPSLAAAAALTSAGAVPWYLPYTDNTAAGPETILPGFLTVWSTRKVRPRFSRDDSYSAGVAAANERIAEAAPSFEKCMMDNED